MTFSLKSRNFSEKSVLFSDFGKDSRGPTYSHCTHWLPQLRFAVAESNKVRILVAVSNLL